MALKRVSTIAWLILAALAIAFLSLVFLAPAEQTLGEVIRYVYVHVALTKAGMWGFYTAGLLGLVVLVTNNLKLQFWTQITAWVALAFFVGGGILSVFAGYASWSGFPLDEPRNQTMFSAIAIALIVLIINHWIPWVRIRGLMYIVLAGYVAWVIPRTPLVLHPGDAGGSSPSSAIRWTFIILPILAYLIGVWLVWFFGRSIGEPGSEY